MKRTLTFMFACLVFVAPRVAAEEVEFGWKTDVEYDSLIVSQGAGQQDDFIFTSGPTVRIRGEHRRFRYEIDHESAYAKYMDLNQLDDWDHRLNISGTYVIHPQLNLSVSNSFSNLSRLQTGEDQLDPELVDPIGDDPSLNVESGSFTSNVFSAALVAVPTERITLTTRASHLFRQFDQTNLNAQDTSSVTSENFGTYRLSENHQLGAGFRFTRRDFETGASSDDDNRSDTFQFFGIWTWVIDERSTFSIRAGPAWTDDELQPAVTSPLALLPSGQLGSAFCPAANVVPVPPLGDPILEGLITFDPSPPLFPDPLRAPAGVIMTEDCLPSNTPPPGPTEVQRALTPEEIEIITALEPLAPIQGLGDVDDDRDINVFLSMSINRQWDRFGTEFSWTRSDSQTRALGSATIADTVLFRTTYALTPRTTLTGQFRFSRQFTDLDRKVNIPVFSPVQFFLTGLYPELADPRFNGQFAGLVGNPVVYSVETTRSLEQTDDNYTLLLRINHELRPSFNIYTSFNFRYQETELKSDLGIVETSTNTNNDQWQVNMGFNYRFRPIRFF